jgi:hypothetical protein
MDDIEYQRHSTLLFSNYHEVASDTQRRISTSQKRRYSVACLINVSVSDWSSFLLHLTFTDQANTRLLCRVILFSVVSEHKIHNIRPFQFTFHPLNLMLNIHKRNPQINFSNNILRFRRKTRSLKRRLFIQNQR